ncbi:MAG: cobalamin B12-binding domain-containing protein [Phycisphaeraceae bacterium]|nr:cobalamin B12-binding domain-containing protein [Phycisphaeraceae bacterium]
MRAYAAEIINDHLLDGMKTVGELFGSGQMQLPFVLQSAEVMKMAVARLEPLMEKAEGQTRGSIVLATVKGDVHDIGKNLVDIILSNNGYTVHNIGIKQPLSAILEKWKDTKADAIGMSGLLVKSVNVMEENLRELNKHELRVPILLGGAALTRHYAEGHLRSTYRGSLYYGKDAFDGLRIMDALMQGRGAEISSEIEQRLAKRTQAEATIAESRARRARRADALDSGESVAVADGDGSSLEPAPDIPTPPFLGSRVVESLDLDEIFPFINTVALFRGQWQFRKGARTDEQYARFVEEEVEPIFERLKARCREDRILRPAVVYGYFACNSDGDDLIIYDPGTTPDAEALPGLTPDVLPEIARFSFPRQQGKRRLCLSDFFLPRSAGRPDVIGFHCVTMGSRVSDVARDLFERNEYTEYLYMHGLGVEAAEGLAELWHKRMRQELGIAADDSPKIRDLFAQRYRGSRYSFGYPACPALSDQEALFRLLDPRRIGCTLTENWQIDPEQSTSALIAHHPQARYFAV